MAAQQRAQAPSRPPLLAPPPPPRAEVAVIDVRGHLRWQTGYDHTTMTGWVGPEGRDRIDLDPGLRMSGWVNGRGLIMPDRYPLNVLGSATLITLGAARHPHAGTVVIAGEVGPTRTVTALTAQAAAVVHQVHTALVNLLLGREHAGGPGWQRMVCEHMVSIGAAARPDRLPLSGPAAVAALRRTPLGDELAHALTVSGPHRPAPRRGDNQPGHFDG